MYLLYLDDSGSSQNAQEEYLVLGGISVFERQAYHLSQSLDLIAEKFNKTNPESVEFHASEIFRGKSSPWNAIKTAPERKGILSAVLKILADDRFGTTAFACAVHKKSFPNDDPMHVAFEELCNRFDHQLRRMFSQGEPQRGMIVIDESAYETTLQGLARDFRTVGTRWGTIRNMAEVPLFVNSKACRCIQLADHVAYAVFRRYNGNDTSYLDPILGKFDSDGQGKLHGLVHKQTYDLNCMCPACMSRRITQSGPGPLFPL